MSGQMIKKYSVNKATGIKTPVLSDHEKVFHESTGMSNAGKYNAPTPFQIVKATVKTVGKEVNKGMTKVVGKIMAPTVNVMKKRDAEMQEMSRKAKSGEFNR